jgi:hypothetical protein
MVVCTVQTGPRPPGDQREHLVVCALPVCVGCCAQFDIRDTIAGVCGSLACVYVGNPFDVAKTRMQTRPDAFRGLLDCFVQTFRREGVTAYWKGSSAAAVSAMTENAVVRRVLIPSHQAPSAVAAAACGLLPLARALCRLA